jgi:predicted nucleotidyltransferase
MAPEMSETSLAEGARKTLERAPAEVLAVYLYGSRARATSRAQSDMDLGILLRDDPQPALRNARGGSRTTSSWRCTFPSRRSS